jgi:hypothetical protein
VSGACAQRRVCQSSALTLETIDFFVYSSASPAAAFDHDRALDEAHWSYMDRFADQMVARGPTLTPDRETWTGSLHIVDLPDLDAAHEFVEREPYNRAGLYSRHLIRRFENLLGRTMWESQADGDDPLFLAIAHTPVERLAHERLIVYGELQTPAGAAVVLQAASREAVEAFLGSEFQIRDWEFGGRR